MQTKRRNANAVLSLQQFAHSKSKGTRRAIETYRQKRQNKFNHRAGLVREYRKALKTEGFEHKTVARDGGGNGNRKRKSEIMEENDANTDDAENVKGDDRLLGELGCGIRPKNDGCVTAKTSLNDIKENDDIHDNDVRREIKRPKFDPFAKARAKAKRNKEVQVQHHEHIRKQLKVKEVKLKERKKRSKVMSKRTRRGQPIMKNVISAMLGKLQEESKKEE